MSTTSIRSTAQGGPGIVTNGLVLYLDAANPLSYPGSGNNWYDLTASGNNGTFGASPSTPVFNSEKAGNITFDGSNDFIQLSLTSTQMNLDYITIIAWVNVNNAGQGYVINAQFANNIVPFSLNVGGNASVQALDGIAFYSGSTSTSWRNSGPIVKNIRGDGLWHQVTGTFDGTTSKYYIDGILDSSTTEGNGFILPKNNEYPRIGSYTIDSGYYSGKIAIVKIYNRALTNIEILQNYNTLKPRFVS